MKEITKIIESDLPDLEKLARVYQWTTSQYIEAAQQQVELLQALGDREAQIKEQIKLGMMETAWEMFEFCFLKVTGRRVRNDEQKS